MKTPPESAPGRLMIAAVPSSSSIAPCASCTDRMGQAGEVSVAPGGDPQPGRAAIRLPACWIPA